MVPNSRVRGVNVLPKAQQRIPNDLASVKSDCLLDNADPSSWFKAYPILSDRETEAKDRAVKRSKIASLELV